MDQRTKTLYTNLVLVGPKSANDRYYPEDVLIQAVEEGLYDGVPVFLDHDEKIQSLVGQVVRAFWDKEKKCIRGDVELFSHSPFSEVVRYIFENLGDQFGFSHVVEADVEEDKGREVVKKIGKVRSVDLVVDPATTKGIHDLHEKMEKAKENVLKECSGNQSGAITENLVKSILVSYWNNEITADQVLVLLSRVLGLEVKPEVSLMAEKKDKDMLKKKKEQNGDEDKEMKKKKKQDDDLVVEDHEEEEKEVSEQEEDEENNKKEEQEEDNEDPEGGEELPEESLEEQDEEEEDDEDVKEQEEDEEEGDEDEEEMEVEDDDEDLEEQEEDDEEDDEDEDEDEVIEEQGNEKGDQKGGQQGSSQGGEKKNPCESKRKKYAEKKKTAKLAKNQKRLKEAKLLLKKIVENRYVPTKKEYGIIQASSDPVSVYEVLAEARKSQKTGKPKTIAESKKKSQEDEWDKMIKEIRRRKGLIR